MTEVLTCPQCHAELPDNAPAGMCPRCLMEAALGDSSDDYQSAAESPYAETTPQPRSFLPPKSGVLANQFPQLEILELLGQGGMGAVYKARQPKLDRLVALKIIRPESADDPTFAERFNREAKTLARLNHPNIVAVHDFGEITLTDEESGDRPKTLYYFLMEYVDGANLRQLMDRGELSPGQALEIVPQICDALQFAHDEGVVHRDIKPENILVDSRGRVKIADFGLAKLASPSEHDFTLTGTHQVMGTPRYMAPEQMAGSRAVDHRADLYALGVVFYEMLTGEIPAGHFSPPSRHAAIDVRLDDVVMKALAPKPEDRFQQASEIRSRLEAISSGDSESVISQPEPPPARGISTIFEREIGAAWNWVMHPDEARGDSGKTETAAFPRLLFVTLAVLGGLTMFLPWAAIHMDQDTVVSFVEGGATLTASVDEVFSGTSVYSSVAASGLCFLILIVLILVPNRRSPGLIAAGLLTMFSLASFIHTLTYQKMIRSEESVDLPLEVRGLAALRQETLDKTGVWSSGREVTEAEVASKVYTYPKTVSLRSPSLFEYVSYREGFYASLGFSLSLLLLSIITVRNAFLNREPKPETAESWSGTPLASLRFQVPAKGDLGSKIKFHFLGLGYELEKEQPGTWIFQRGTMMGGMMQSDIRAYPTRVSIHAIDEDNGSHLVNCHWSVRLMGGWAGKSDVKILEDEGRELQSLLGGRMDQPEAATATPVPAEAHVPQESVLEPGGEAPVASADEVPIVPRSMTMDLSAVEDEVRGPAIAMMVVGLLMMIGHVIAIPVMIESMRSDDLAWMPIPGIVIGMAMLAGGIGLHVLRSRGWAQVGIVAGFLPVTPAWIFTMMVSTWVSNILGKPQVTMAFVERRRRRREDVKQAFLQTRRLEAQSVHALGEKQQSRRSSQAWSFTIAFVVWTIGMVIVQAISYPWARNLVGEDYYFSRSRTLIPKSEAYEQITLRAIGLKNAGDLTNPADVPLRRLEFELEPLPYSPYQGADGTLTVELDTLGYTIGMERPPGISSPEGFNPGEVKQWMSLTGVDLNAEGVEREARALFEIAHKARDIPLDELIDEESFTVQSETMTRHSIPYQNSEHVRYCLYIWLGSTLLIVAVTLSRRNITSPSVGRLITKILATLAVVVIVAGVMYLLLNADIMETGKVPSPPPPNSSGEQPPPLHRAADRGDVGEVKQLLDAGAGVNDKDPIYGQTPLMYAAGEGNTSMAATLILLGADVNEKDKQGRTALMFAVENQHEPVRKAIEKLVEISQIENADERQEKLRSFPGVDKRLIAGLDVDLTDLEIDRMAQDASGESVLMKAVKSKNLAYLRDADYDYEVAALQNREGWTALRMAIRDGDADDIRQIYNVGKRPVYLVPDANFIPDFEVNPMFDPRALSGAPDGVTVLQFAERLGRSEAAKLIREDMQRLIEIASRALDSQTLQPTLRKPWLELRGHAYRALGEKDKAEADFQQARGQE